MSAASPYFLAALALLWSVKIQLAEILPLVRHHFFLRDASWDDHQVRLAWCYGTLLLALFWDASPMRADLKPILAVLVRLWAETLNGCTRKTFVLAALFLIALALVLSLVHFSSAATDLAPAALLAALTVATARLLLADPKAHAVPPACAAQMLKTRIKTR